MSHKNSKSAKFELLLFSVPHFITVTLSHTFRLKKNSIKSKFFWKLFYYLKKKGFSWSLPVEVNVVKQKKKMIQQQQPFSRLRHLHVEPLSKKKKKGLWPRAVSLVTQHEHTLHICCKKNWTYKKKGFRKEEKSGVLLGRCIITHKIRSGFRTAPFLFYFLWVNWINISLKKTP